MNNVSSNHSQNRINVERVARSANLRLTDDEKLRFGEELQAIVAFAQQLSEADTETAAPTELSTVLQSVMRSDSPSSPYTRTQMLENAPTVANGYITVPKLL